MHILEFQLDFSATMKNAIGHHYLSFVNLIINVFDLYACERRTKDSSSNESLAILWEMDPMRKTFKKIKNKSKFHWRNVELICLGL